MAFIDSHGNLVTPPDSATVTWRISGYAIISRNNQFLMVQSGSGQWIFPGGGVDEHETLAKAVVRECIEETGYSVSVSNNQPYYVREQQFYHTREDAFYHSIQLFYSAELVNDSPDVAMITHHDKTRTVDWVDLANTDMENIHPTIHDLVKKLAK